MGIRRRERSLSGWGRVPRVRGTELSGPDLALVAQEASLTRGLGRSYGDASLPPSRPPAAVASSLGASRILDFDDTSGTLRAEAGVTLSQLVQRYLPGGWFVPVSPGTQRVTLGGMIAADVHGKNHHVAGTFGAWVRSLTLCTGQGRIVDAGPDRHEDLFDATLGGMGLTGHILQATVTMERVPSPWIVARTTPAADLDALLAGLREASARSPMTMAWADCLSRGARRGRGAVIEGRWAQADEAPQGPPRPRPRIRVPVTAPDSLLSRPALSAFNALRFAGYRRAGGERVTAPEPFFHPLDVLDDWSRLYGRRGMTQYQCVLPWSTDTALYHRLLDIVDEHGSAVFLCVVKDCGPEGRGLLSFPKPGVSFAMDMPVDAARTPALVDALNDHTIAHGGRIYLAKDAFTRAEHYRAMEPRLDAWTQVRRRWDPELRLRSALSERLFGDAD